MRRILLFLTLAAGAAAQSNVVPICDRQATSHCWYLTGGATLAADHVLTFGASSLASTTDAVTFPGFYAPAAAGNTTGGYVDFPPITYPPTSGTTCYDAYGNVVSQPTPIGGGSFPSADVMIWNSTSPMQGYKLGTWTINVPTSANYYLTGTPCAAPLPVPDGTPYGINSNSYFFSSSGFASSDSAFDTIQLLTDGSSHGRPAGGALAGAFTASTTYPAGTQLRAGATLPSGVTVDGSNRLSNQYGAYLGGYVRTGFADQWPGGVSGTCTSIASCDNPLETPGPVIPGLGTLTGMMAYNTAAGCEGVNNGTSWTCLLAAGSAVTSITGTANEVIVGGTSTVPVLSTPQAIGTSSSVTFGTIASGGDIQSNATSGYAFTGWNGSTDYFLVDHLGDITASGNLVNVGYITTETWLGLPPTSGIPSTAPGSSYGALSYKSGSTYWYYNASTPGWATVDLSAVGGSSNWTLSGSVLYPNSTSSKVLVGETSDVSGAALEVNGSTAVFGTVNVAFGGGSGSSIAYQVTLGGATEYQVDGAGDVSGGGVANFIGGYKSNGVQVISGAGAITAQGCTGCAPAAYASPGLGGAVNTVYHNTSSYGRMVQVIVTLNSLGSEVACLIGATSSPSTVVYAAEGPAYSYQTVHCPVPPGYYYDVLGYGPSQPTVSSWYEFY